MTQIFPYRLRFLLFSNKLVAAFVSPESGHEIPLHESTFSPLSLLL